MEKGRENDCREGESRCRETETVVWREVKRTKGQQRRGSVENEIVGVERG